MGERTFVGDRNLVFELEDLECSCLGNGWAQSDQGEWVECPCHFEGQLHPESRVLLLDQPDRLNEEDRKSRIKYKIAQEQQLMSELEFRLKEAKRNIALLELELINRTPTVRGMPAVRPEDWLK